MLTDTTPEELVEVIKLKVESCRNLLPHDVTMAFSSREGVDCATAEVYLENPGVAIEVRKSLEGQLFGGFTLELEYVLGPIGRTMFVGGISGSTTLSDKTLRAFCEKHGPIERMDVQYARGYALVMFKELNHAIQAVEALRAVGKLGNNLLRVTFANPDGSEARPRRPGLRGDPRDRDREMPERERERERDFGRAINPPAPLRDVPAADRAAVDEAMKHGLRYFLVANVLSPRDIEAVHSEASRCGTFEPAFIVSLPLIVCFFSHLCPQSLTLIPILSFASKPTTIGQSSPAYALWRTTVSRCCRASIPFRRGRLSLFHCCAGS